MTTSYISTKQRIIQFIEKINSENKKLSEEEFIEVLESLKKVSKNTLFIDNLIKSFKDLNSNKHVSKLTPREREVMQLIGEGFQNKEIAEQLMLSKSTIETHRKNIRKKLRLNNNEKLFTYAFSLKVLTKNNTDNHSKIIH